MPMQWYVIQVTNGREDAMASLVGRIVPEGALAEVFSPKYATQIKVRGEWVDCDKLLLPGYLIAVTDDPSSVARELSRIPEFCRIVRQGDAFVPLKRDEVDFIGRLTRPGRRVVPMSRGMKVGEKVVITEGPLVGHEGLIKEINRRKSTAYLELDLCGRRVVTRVGLGIVAGPEEEEGRAARAIAACGA